ncbi:HAD-IIIA family hydrolase [Candidatus Pacearchaeota archaeon]|nr:HAD-IIIA family hydrolase [Candidatus Pacearchaeota archaeon]
MVRGVFLDRDGVVCFEKNHLVKAEEISLIHNSGKGIKMLNDAGYKTIIVSNQAAIANGMCKIEDVRLVNKCIEDILEYDGAIIDKFYFCPHHPGGIVPEYSVACNCRKPAIGMLLQAARDFSINLNESWMIGDKTIDVAAGKSAGCRTILVETGYGGKDEIINVQPTFLAKNLYEAVSKIILKEK